MAKTELFARYQPGGVFTIVNEKMTTGEIFWVHSGTGTDGAGYGNNPDAPFASVAYANSLCTASKGDLVIAMPGHAETTTAIALNKAGVKILGLGYGRNRPTLTATTAATDLVNVTAANVELENIRLVGAASGVTSLLDTSTAGDDLLARYCSFEQAATPVMGVTLNGDRFRFVDCDFIGTADGPDYALSIETKCHDWLLERCRFFYRFGLDNGIIKSVAACEGYVMRDLTVVGVDTLLINFSSSSAGAPDGLFESGHVMASAALTSIEDLVAAATSKGCAFGAKVYATDATGVAAGRIPLTTAS